MSQLLLIWRQAQALGQMRQFQCCDSTLQCLERTLFWDCNVYFGLIQIIFPLLPCLGKKSFRTVEAAPILQFPMGVWRQSSPGNIESWGTSCFTFLITASTPSVRDVSWKRAANLCEIFIRSFALPALSTLPNPWEIFFFFLRGVSLNFLWPSRFREQAVESLTNATLKPYVWAQLCKIILCRLLTYKGYFCFPTSLNWHEQILNLLSRGTGLQQRKHWDSICCQLSM